MELIIILIIIVCTLGLIFDMEDKVIRVMAWLIITGGLLIIAWPLLILLLVGVWYYYHLKAQGK